jgi:hypothetical protein
MDSMLFQKIHSNIKLNFTLSPILINILDYVCVLSVNRILLQDIKKFIMTNTDKKSILLSTKEWQIVLDSLSNTIFNEEITEEARKNAKELYLKINKNI